MTLEEAVDKFIDYARQYDKDAPNHHWYVGITTDLKARQHQHEKEKGIKCQHIESLVTTNDRNNALKLEKALEDVGFAKTSEDLDPISLKASASEKEIDIYIYQAVKV